MNRGFSKEKSKYLIYFDLWDSFQEPGCPVCRLLEKNSNRFLDGLLYERVNDVGTREKLRKSLGLCNWHGYKTLEAGSCALGLGIIYEDISKRIIENLDKVQSFLPVAGGSRFLFRLFKRDFSGKAIDQMKSRGRCPACENARLFEQYYLKALLDYLSETDFELRFTQSSGICYSHLGEALKEFSKHKNLRLLVAKEIEKFRSLREELKEFVRKQDFNCRDEPSGSEKDSWIRALEMVIW